MKPIVDETITDRRGFTLIEVLVATAISAIVILAVNTLLYHTFHLRDQAYDTLAFQSAERYALNLLQNDLRNITPPNGTLMGEMVGESGGRGSLANDTLEFYTTTGLITDALPWSDVQKVTYSLMNFNETLSPYGLCLVRAVTRNVLSSSIEQPEYTPILPNVQSLRFYYYDGQSWQTSWDSSTDTSTDSSSSSSSSSSSTTDESPLPKAVQVEMVISRGIKKNAAQDENFITSNLIVPIDTKPLPTPTPVPTSESSSETDDGGQNSNQQQNPGQSQNVNQGGQSGGTRP